MTSRPGLLLVILFFGCNSTTTTKSSSTNDSVQIHNANNPEVKIDKPESADIVSTHLKDTFKIKGNYVLFLRPDSARFESYSDIDENIYDADSDFGVGISNTLDSIHTGKLYKVINANVSESRYILVNDCENCPRIIDRDTLNYGLILTAKGKPIKIITNLHSGDYLDDVNEYFRLQ